MTLNNVPKRWRVYLEQGIARVLPIIILRTCRRNLAGVWVKQGYLLPASGAVLAPNHRSWWDLYLAWLMRWRLGREASGVMHEQQLETFAFFRHIGMISQKEVREALRRLQSGHLLFLFPEGALRSAPRVHDIHEGLGFLAEKANVPVVPLVFKVVMRGAQLPEAFIVVGRAIYCDNREAMKARYLAEMNQLLDEFEHDLVKSDPELPLEGYQCWLEGGQSFHLRMNWLRRWWQ